MWIAIGITTAVCLLILLTIQIAKNEGSKAAQLEALKAELRRKAEEQRRANAIIDSVRNMDESDVRKRLSNLSSKQR